MSKKETDISPSKKKIIKKRNTTLEGFLSQFIIKKGADVEASHTSMGPPFGKYYIPDEKLSKFHNVYHHHVFDHKKDCHLVERHQNVGPIVIDLDFKYKTSDTLPDRRYTVSMIKGFLQLFFKEMSNILILEQDEHFTHRIEDLRSAFVFEKKKPSINPKKKDELKDGLHIMFPFVNTSPDIQYYLRSRVLKRPELKELFKPIEAVNTLDDIIDECVIFRNGWMMYGSRKPASLPYELSRIYFLHEDNGNGKGDKNFIENMEGAGEGNGEGGGEGNGEGAGEGGGEGNGEGDRAGEGVNGEEIGINTNNNETYRKIYKFTKTVLEERDISMYDTNQRVKLFCIRGRKDAQRPVKANAEELIHLYNSTTKKQKEPRITTTTAIANTKTKDRKERKKRSSGKQSNLKPEEIELIKKLIGILGVQRATSYDKWMEVGWCLRSLSPDLFLDDWIQFSFKGSGYGDNESKRQKTKYDCLQRWSKMNDGDFTVASLHFWAKQDNMEQYRAIQSSYRNPIIDDSIKTKHNDYGVACVAYHVYQHQFICASIKNSAWYEFKHTAWEVVDSGFSLLSKFSTELCDIYLQRTNDINQEQIGMDDEDRRKGLVEKASALQAMSSKLLQNSYKNTLLKESANLFYDQQFMERLDANPELLGFEDGVYDLRIHQFRDGRPDDFISFSTKLYYHPEDGEEPYSEDHFRVKEVRTFLSQILPNEKVRDYVLTLFASFLCGSTADEKFHIWTGSGGNGKSKIVELYQNCLGDYATTLPITLLTGKRTGANNASPELSKTRGKRFASLQEPEEDSQIQVGLMKELTGGDKISARGLYEAASEFKPQFKMVLTCNHLPKIPSDDGGTWRRIRVVEFTSEFVDNPVKPNQFKRDYHLGEKMENWKEPFLWILLQRYKVYMQGDANTKPGLHEPEEVLKYTHSYRLNNNIFVEFIDEALVDDEDGFITVTDLYAEFKEWFRESHNLKPPPKKDFQAGMERELGPPEAMFVDQEQQSHSEPTTQTKKKRRKPRKMGWKGFSLQGETHSDVE